jgi:predicted nicotinamide N-methyase
MGTAFIDRLDLSGKSVADIGAGSGMLALAAARAGAANVLALVYVNRLFDQSGTHDLIGVHPRRTINRKH